MIYYHSSKFSQLCDKQSNHLHEIIQINDDPLGVDLRVDPELAEMGDVGGHIGPPLPTIIQWFKTMTTNDYIRAVKNDGWASFDRKNWQRNYYEHIIRNQAELEKVQLYITENPRRWSEDQENRERSLLPMSTESFTFG